MSNAELKRLRELDLRVENVAGALEELENGAQWLPSEYLGARVLTLLGYVLEGNVEAPALMDKLCGTDLGGKDNDERVRRSGEMLTVDGSGSELRTTANASERINGETFTDPDGTQYAEYVEQEMSKVGLTVKVRPEDLEFEDSAHTEDGKPRQRRRRRAPVEEDKTAYCPMCREDYPVTEFADPSKPTGFSRWCFRHRGDNSKSEDLLSNDESGAELAGELEPCDAKPDPDPEQEVRLCSNGDECVSSVEWGQPASLSAGNPADICRACSNGALADV